MRCAVGLLLVLAAAWGCGGGDGSGTGGRRPGVGSAGNGSRPNPTGGSTGSAGDMFGNNQAGQGGRMASRPMAGAGGSTTPAGCGTGRTAEQGLAAVDIVWIIDGSGSMVDEAERVQNNIDSFVAGIAAAGVDTRVVLIGQDDLVPPASALAQSGNYRYVEHDVGSTNALEVLVQRFPDYSDFLRPFAHVHFIVVTDDEARFMNLNTPDARAQAFRDAMGSRLTAAYSVHAIASPGNVGDFGCAPESVPPAIVDCCRQYILNLFFTLPMGCEQYPNEVTPLNCPFLGGAAAPGVTYFTLAQQTSGVGASICSEDWTMVFGSLSDAVIESAPLPCNYEIPAPPPGMTFQRELVNVKYTPPGGDPMAVTPYPNVASAAACGDNLAWYYDDPNMPKEVLLCPAACMTVGSGQGGTVDVLFGCKTIPLE